MTLLRLTTIIRPAMAVLRWWEVSVGINTSAVRTHRSPCSAHASARELSEASYSKP